MTTNQIAYPYASFSRRFGAFLLDALILVIPGCILGSIIPVAGAALAYFLYVPFMESSVIRATIGKKLMGIQVSDMHGQRISFRAAMIRSLMKMISGVFMAIPHLLALFTAKSQAMHDLVAETTVTYGRAEIPAVDAWLDQMKEVFRGMPSLSTGGAASGNRLADLERLQALYERGALSREEFDREKAKVLAD
jgi:uncharacterized RDD family membrane protein YckC